MYFYRYWIILLFLLFHPNKSKGVPTPRLACQFINITNWKWYVWYVRSRECALHLLALVATTFPLTKKVRGFSWPPYPPQTRWCHLLVSRIHVGQMSHKTLGSLPLRKRHGTCMVFISQNNEHKFRRWYITHVKVHKVGWGAFLCSYFRHTMFVLRSVMVFVTHSHTIIIYLD